MGTTVPARHPLRQLFGSLTEKSFTEHLGWPDLNVTSYVSNLLVDFTRTDQLFKIRNRQDKPVETVVDLLFESEVLLEAQSLDREREVHQHIGDFTLFMAGLFPEYLRRLKTASVIYHKDFLVDYVKTGNGPTVSSRRWPTALLRMNRLCSGSFLTTSSSASPASASCAPIWIA